MPHPTDIHVGAKIREYRIALMLTQTDVARAIGKTLQQVQKYESGANRVSASVLFEIANFLGHPVQTFFPPQVIEAAA